MTYDVFISYSRKDTAVADRICAAFDRAGISYFIDRQGIAGGMEFPKILAPAIKESEVFLLLASENAYQSPFTTREILYAFNKKRGEKMLPYIIDGSVLPDDVEFVFSSTNWRTMHEHPIDPVLVDDVLKLLGRSRQDVSRILQQETDKLIQKADSWLKEKKYDEIFHYIRPLALQGHPVAEYYMGSYYADIEEFEKAVEWFRKSAEQEYAKAQLCLAREYLYGQGVSSSDIGEALRWFRKAAEQGEVGALKDLGFLYKEGILGVTQDKDEARRWYQKAADQGDEDAKEELLKL